MAKHPKGAPENTRKHHGRLRRYQFKDDADFDGWLVGIKADADELIKSNKGQGGLFSPPAEAEAGRAKCRSRSKRPYPKGRQAMRRKTKNLIKNLF